MSSLDTLTAVRKALSPARMARFETAVSATPPSQSAQDLYAWNALTSGAFLMPLHICEIVTRNAVSEVLEARYGSQWPWSAGFERSLPDPNKGYNPRRDLANARKHRIETSSVIPELNFYFWQSMFTGRHDARLWSNSLSKAFPELQSQQTVQQSRRQIFENLEQIRRLRNRVAHHEPILGRDLMKDYERIRSMISIRCPLTAQWMTEHQEAVRLIHSRP
jgi:hypothetical protein